MRCFTRVRAAESRADEKAFMTLPTAPCSNAATAYLSYAVAAYVLDTARNPCLRTVQFLSGGVADGIRTHDNRNHNPGLYH
jgi:hypothetical protein